MGVRRKLRNRSSSCHVENFLELEPRNIYIAINSPTDNKGMKNCDFVGAPQPVPHRALAGQERQAGRQAGCG